MKNERQRPENTWRRKAGGTWRPWQTCYWAASLSPDLSGAVLQYLKNDSFSQLLQDFILTNYNRCVLHQTLTGQPDEMHQENIYLWDFTITWRWNVLFICNFALHQISRSHLWFVATYQMCVSSLGTHPTWHSQLTENSHTDVTVQRKTGRAAVQMVLWFFLTC